MLLDGRSLRKEVEEAAWWNERELLAWLRFNSVFSFPLAGRWLAAEDWTAR